MKSKIVLVFVVCIMAVIVSGCMVSNSPSTPTATVIPDEVYVQIEKMCTDSTVEVFDKPYEIYIEQCQETIIQGIENNLGQWPGPQGYPSLATEVSNDILHAWFGNDGLYNNSVNHGVLMYHLCVARHTLQDEGYLIPPPEDPECSR
jgi:hypothetical protein